MIVFFDTSALVKYFHEEQGTGVVTALIDNEHNISWISSLAKLEFLSSVLRRYRMGEINKTQVDIAMSGFEETCKQFHVTHLGKSTFQEAEHLMREYAFTHGLKTLDSLQLAAFMLIREENWVFVAADDVLLTVAQLSGAKTINPIVNQGMLPKEKGCDSC
jgi:predicted nucleic acid-binding protein